MPSKHKNLLKVVNNLLATKSTLHIYSEGNNNLNVFDFLQLSNQLRASEKKMITRGTYVPIPDYTLGKAYHVATSSREGPGEKSISKLRAYITSINPNKNYL